ncbi:MAG: penicillin acylase family protein [Hyphomonadaceae bacterium]
MRAVLRWAGRIALGLIALVVIIAGAVVWQFAASRPQLSGDVRVAGLSAPARIIRDEHGVPHIFGESARDVYFALGYAHAQDRFFQMDLTRRSMQGRLSELVGELTLRFDAQARIRGFNQIAAAQAAALSPELRGLIQAYADGVNARLARGAPSPEYALLMASPEEWDIEDTAAVALAMTDNLVGGFEREINEARLAARLSAAQLNEFYPAYPSWAPRSIDPRDLLHSAGAASNPGARAEDDAQPGSNGWVVSGALTESGHPILANDPHLPFAAPGPFYLVHLALPEGPLVGVTLPGAPFVVIGRNGELAWTNTTNEIDAEDLIDAPEGGFANVTAREERIRVRTSPFSAREETIEARDTPDGPILDPAWFSLEPLNGRVVALRSAALYRENGVATAVVAMARAQSVPEFIAAAEPWTAPFSNVLVASRSGQTGLLSTGRFPLRDANGRWTGSVPWAEQPNVIDPVAGYLTTANNLITPDSYPHPMPGSYAVYRVARITEQLRAGRVRTLGDAQTLQRDVSSIYVRRLLPVLTQAAEPQTEAGRAALARLRAWDGAMSRDAAEPLIFAAWTEALGQAIYSDELGEELFERARGPRMQFLDAILTGALGHWCDVQVTQPVETCVSLEGPALDRAAAMLAERYGADMSAWTWGAAHQAVFDHPLLTNVPVLGDMFTVRAPIGGDSDSVSVGIYANGEGDYTSYHGAGLRVVYDLGDLDRSRYVIAPGQSGHPWSPHFRDLMPLWSAGEGFEIRTDWDPRETPRGSRTLTLSPRR